MAEEQKKPASTFIFSDLGAVLKAIFVGKKKKKDGDNFLDYLVKQAGLWNISRALFLWLLFAGLYAILSIEIPHLGVFTEEWFVGTAPVWLPIGLWLGAWRAWVWYIQSLYISGRDGVVLEIKMPREITKSPRAMEVARTGPFLCKRMFRRWAQS